MSTSEQIALLAVGASTVVGLLTLWVSWRASRTRDSALKLAEMTYSAEHRLSITSSTGEDCLVLAPQSADQSINSITLYFPQKIEISPIILTSGDFRLFDVRISSKLRSYWDSRTPAPVTQNSPTVRDPVPTPVVAIVHGQTQGEAVITVGYYDLYSQYVRSDGSSSSITIKSLAFNNYGCPSDDPQEVVDRMLSAHESHSRPPSTSS